VSRIHFSSSSLPALSTLNNTSQSQYPPCCLKYSIVFFICPGVYPIIPNILVAYLWLCSQSHSRGVSASSVRKLQPKGPSNLETKICQCLCFGVIILRPFLISPSSVCCVWSLSPAKVFSVSRPSSWTASQGVSMALVFLGLGLGVIVTYEVVDRA